MSGMAPCGIRCERDALMLKTTALHRPKFWMLVSHEGEVFISKQTPGTPAEQEISIPRNDFKKMLDWYFKEQK